MVEATTSSRDDAVVILPTSHRSWQGELSLQPGTSRVRSSVDGAGGTYLQFGADVEILWDRHVVERFRQREGRLVHVDLLAPPDAVTSVRQAAVRGPACDRRVAIVTAYHKEERSILQRCLTSVRRQTVAADHIVVADGHPQDWIDGEDVRHIRLDRSHGDYGNTPRGIGALLAIAEDYDAIAFLDADNWLLPIHVELALATARQAGGPHDYIIAQRNMVRPDGTVMPIPDEPIDSHVDTNCFVFLPGSYHHLQTFALVPRKLAGIGDRIFFAGLRKQHLRFAVVATKTVNYHCIWSSLYDALGERPPADAKPNIDQAPMVAWIAGLTPDQRLVVNRRTNGVI